MTFNNLFALLTVGLVSMAYGAPADLSELKNTKYRSASFTMW